MRTAATLIVVGIILATVPSMAADPKDEAKVRFDKGVALFKDADYDAALVEFKAAYAVEPHYAVRYNIGITLHKLHRYGDAFEELEAYLFEGGDAVSAEKAAEVEGILDELRDLVGLISIKCEVASAKLFIDDEPSAKWMVRVDVGEHKVEVKAEGYESFTKKVEVPGGKGFSLKVDLVPLEGKQKASKAAKDKQPKKKLPVVPFAAMAGLAGVLALTATITGAVSLSREKTYAGMEFTDNWRAYRDSTRSLTIATDVLWGFVGASAITAIVLAIFTKFGGKEKKQALSLMPTFGLNGLLLEGSF